MRIGLIHFPTIQRSSFRQRAAATSERRAAVARLAWVLAGIVIGQAILYGPSLIGVKVLLPLRLLEQFPVFTPGIPGLKPVEPHDFALTDLVFYAEPERYFAMSELRAGRLPLWSPYRFGGSPMWPLGLSPPWWPAYLIASPVVLAWTQMLVALVAGLGAYLFFRRVLQVGYWPAAVAAWCYPLSGAYVVWTGFWLPAVMCWLPWMLLCVDRAVRRPLSWGGPGICVCTLFALIGGAADIAGQVLLASGIFGIWCLLDEHGVRGWKSPRRPLASVGTLALGWILGIGASAWLIFPLFEYQQTGARMIDRSHGREERPPEGLFAATELLVPDFYGSTQNGSIRLLDKAFPEGAVGGYVGMLAALLAAPLAFASRRHRSINVFWIILIFITLSWILNVPGMVRLLRLPGLNMMSHNRFVFVSGFAILALAVTGVDAMQRGPVRSRRWFVVPVIALLALGGWCAFRAVHLPEPVRTRLGLALSQGHTFPSVTDQADVAQVQRTFVRNFAIASAVAGLALAGWVLLWRFPMRQRQLVAALSACIVLELLWFGYGRAAQSYPYRYYPPVPMLEQIAHLPPGRIIGFDCLPANLAQMVRLPDIRGYDGIDPARMMDLLTKVASPNSLSLPHALTQWMTPVVGLLSSGGCDMVPILDMLNVRYVIFRGEPLTKFKPDFQAPGYWGLINLRAMPRVYVPTRVEMVSDSAERIARLVSSQFNPAQVAYVETPVQLPENCRGEAAILEEIPTRITVSLNMQTAGLVVLADLWDRGWHAYLNGRDVPILRANHAVRGVEVPAGKGSLVFRFEPESFRVGLYVASVALLACAAWSAAAYLCAGRAHTTG